MQEGYEVIPGVTVLDTPGHTPGHMSVLVTDGDQSLLALGDSMNHAWMNFAHPDWYNGSDTDGPLAVTTRRKLLDMAAADRIAVLAYHFPFPGVGHVMAEGEDLSLHSGALAVLNPPGCGRAGRAGRPGAAPPPSLRSRGRRTASVQI